MSLPSPEPGLVLSYSYLWLAESTDGREDGSKIRPCVIVLASQNGRVLVAPITHSPPSDLATAVELPEKTKQRLGLDERPMWVICNEVNEFIWPGPDIRPLSTKTPDKYHFGILPPKLFAQIILKISLFARGRQRFKIVRTE